MVLIGYVADGPLKRILDRTTSMSPEDRAVVLEDDANLASVHEERLVVL